MIDQTFENLVELLVKVSRERDEALERCSKQNQQVFELMMERKEIADLCDEWEQKNGDAPHRTVRLTDRIRVNAGLPLQQSGDGKKPG